MTCDENSNKVIIRPDKRLTEELDTIGNETRKRVNYKTYKCGGARRCQK